MQKRLLLLLILGIPILGLLFYQLPPVKSRLEWRIAVWTAEIRRAINPPEEVVFVPSTGGGDPGATEVAAQVTATLGAILEATPTRTILNTATPGPTQPPTSTPAPTETPT
ncbi:MAG TPA: hypothetical protein VMN57_14320, partial [Anaerolineales bacterium]|nr:hypothetical protein [Anaerolineales bacterium]